jgi:hypothetical protein
MFYSITLTWSTWLHPISVLFTLKMAITMQAETMEQYTPDTLTLKSKITRWIQATEKQWLDNLQFSIEVL